MNKKEMHAEDDEIVELRTGDPMGAIRVSHEKHTPAKRRVIMCVELGEAVSQISSAYEKLLRVAGLDEGGNVTAEIERELPQIKGIVFRLKDVDVKCRRSGARLSRRRTREVSDDEGETFADILMKSESGW